jgi:hypothetical protein
MAGQDARPAIPGRRGQITSIPAAACMSSSPPNSPTASAPPPTQSRTGPQSSTCVKAIFDSYQERDDLHEVLFRHGGHVAASHRATHALVLDAISDVFASGKAAGAFDVEDPEATAVLCWASTHGFDPDFHGDAAPADARLIRAAQQLFRRAAGIPGDPPG